MIGGQFVLVGGMALLGFLLGPQAMKVVMPILLLTLLGAWAIWMVRFLRPTPRTVDLMAGRVVVDGGKGGDFPVVGAALGPWRAPALGVTTGTVLHLSDGTRTLRIGGRDHRPSPGVLLPLPAVETVDLYMTSAVFQELLQVVRVDDFQAPRHAPAPSPAATSSAPTGAVPAAARAFSCPLLPNPTSARGAFRTMAPWLGTLVVVGIIAGVSGNLGITDTPAGQTAVSTLVMVCIVGGIALTVYRSIRKTPQATLEIDAREIRLKHPGTGQVTACSWRQEVPLSRGMCTVNMRSGSVHYPVLRLPLTGARNLTIGVYDPRFHWTDTSARESGARYLVGPPDWLALVAALGLSGVSYAKSDGW